MRMIACTLAATLVIGGAAFAANDPDEFLQGKSTTIKPGKLAKFSGKPTSVTPLPSNANAPTVGGGVLRVFDTGQIGNSDSYTLAASGWSRIPKNESKPLKGYKFKGQPCKSVIVKANVVKANCKGSAIQLDTPFTGNVGIVLNLGLNLGDSSKRYCALFGGSGKNEAKKVKYEGASAPTACPSPLEPTTSTLTPSTTSTTRTSTTTSTTGTGVVPTTTSTSTPDGSSTSTSTSTPDGSSTSTSTSTPDGGSTSTSTSTPDGSSTSTSTSTPDGSSTSTSTSTPGSSTTSTTSGGSLCCDGASFVSFVTGNLPGDCGDIIEATGTLERNIACAGLFTGGGGNSVPLPFAVPDLGQAVSAITECTGQDAVLGGSTSAETGSNRNCTTTGCLFGAPLAVPNPGSTPTSVCVLNAATASLTGDANCETGATDVTLPLASVIFLSGDILTTTGIQPCPLCTGGSPTAPNSGTCQGGSNGNGMCTPGTTVLNAAYPTSHDCPPVASLSIGTLPIAFQLTTGSIRWSGTTATNDATTTKANQQRVFSGFCRDSVLPGATGAFENPAQKCWENGMASGPACGGDTFETCEQRNGGAFGPNGGAIRTILAVGNAMSILGGSGPATLVSIFSIAPTFDPTVDGAGDLPGPGAVALPGTATLCTTANPCP